MFKIRSKRTKTTEYDATYNLRLTMRFYFAISQGRYGLARERVQRMRRISCVVLALKKAEFFRCSVSVPASWHCRNRNPTKKSPFPSDIAICRNLRQAKFDLLLYITVLSVLRFPALFQNESVAATTEGDGAPSNREEQTTSVVHSDEIEIDKSTSETIVLVLSTIQESMNTSNVLLRELLQQKRKSESSEHTELAAK